MAPFEPRSDLFLESWFHQGSLDFPPGSGRAARSGSPRTARSSSTSCSTGRPCSPRCCRVAGAVVGSYGTSDDALLDALTGAIAAAGAAAVRPAALDGAGARRTARTCPGYDDPLFAFGHGLRL